MASKETYSPLPPWPRSDYCGALRATDAGRAVSLWGWVAARRDHGGLIFIDLRDREGIVQLVFNPAKDSVAHQVAEDSRAEFYIAARGKVVLRSSSTINRELPTGEIEIAVSEAEIVNISQPPPFPISDEGTASEETRLKYRYLDLRRPRMQKNLRTRHRALKAVRGFLDQNGFVEVETPILFKSTPEGSRDYLVPSRLNPGKFYALPQSPQLLKQMLMVAGFDRYYQIARCFRDEDLRANRQPEFTQIDLEMTGPRLEDVFAVGEGMMTAVYREVMDAAVTTPFPRIPFEQALERFGSDKPDLRLGLELCNLGSCFPGTEFKLFAEALARGEAIYGIALPAAHQLTRRELDQTVEAMRAQKGLGLTWVRVAEGGWQGPIAKFLSDDERARVEKTAALGLGATLLMMAGAADQVRPALGELRLELGDKFNLVRQDELRFLWVVDFPLFEYDPEEKRLVSVNHPFTAPHPEDLPLLEREPLKAHALCYDLVLNGQEMASGSIRIHSRDLQLRIFELLGFSREETMARFGFLIEALGYGAPPHGGMALGVDRLTMMLCGTDSLREVLAFPKTQKAVDPMSGAPSEVDPRQLKELSIKVTV